MKNPVQYKTESGEWKDLIIMDETIYDISKAVEMVRASERSNIKLKQDYEAGLFEWES
jgi:hypothetical protein